MITGHARRVNSDSCIGCCCVQLVLSGALFLQLLAREAASFQEAESWLRGTASLTSHQREQILEELHGTQKSSEPSQSVDPGTPTQPAERPLWNSSSDAPVAAEAAQPREAPCPDSADPPQSTQQPVSKGSQQQAGPPGCSTAAPSGSAGNASSGGNVAASSGADEGPNRGPWYGHVSGSLSRWWSQVRKSPLASIGPLAKQRRPR